MAPSSAQRGQLFPRLRRLSTTEHVQRMLREAIVEGRISQGDPLREVHIAGMLGTGRGSVREAIRQLVQEGLVEYRLHRGAFVRVLSVEDALDIYAAREAIEVFAVERILEEQEPPDFSGLERRIEEMRQTAAGDSRPSAELIGADLDFHRELARLGGSTRLSQAYETLAAENRMALRHHPPYPLSTYVSDHERLLVALKERDAAASELVREHLRSSARLISDAIAHEPDSRQKRTEEAEPPAVERTQRPADAKEIGSSGLVDLEASKTRRTEGGADGEPC
jgi:DNA-binding GntR family transcriptional regulator